MADISDPSAIQDQANSASPDTIKDPGSFVVYYGQKMLYGITHVYICNRKNILSSPEIISVLTGPSVFSL